MFNLKRLCTTPCVLVLFVVLACFALTVDSATVKMARIGNSVYPALSVRTVETVQESKYNFLCYNGTDPTMHSQVCQEQCLDGSRDCNGDINYCNAYNCSMYVSECFCKGQIVISRNETLIDGVYMQAEIFFQEEGPHASYVIPFSPHQDSRDPSLAVQKQSDDLIITTPREAHTRTLTLSVIRQHCFGCQPTYEEVNITTANNDRKQICLKNKESIRGIRCNGKYVYQQKENDHPPLTAEDYCRLGKCAYCSNFQVGLCQLGTLPWITILSFFASFICMVAFSAWVMYILLGLLKVFKVLFKVIGWFGRNMFCCMAYPFRYMGNKAVHLSHRTGLTDVIYDRVPNHETQFACKCCNAGFDLEEDYMEHLQTDQHSQAVRNLRRNSTTVRGNFTGTNVMLLTLICLVCVVTAQLDQTCSTVINSVSEIKNCVAYNATHNECKVQPTVTATLLGTGVTSCINIVANNSVPLGQVKVRFSDYLATAPLSAQYYTANWSPYIETANQCFLTACCTYSSYGSCASFNGDQDKNPCGLFSSQYNNGISVTRCQSNSGCAGCGCFSCAPKCQFWRGTLVPTGHVYMVATPSTVYYSASMDIDWPDQHIDSAVTTSSPQIDNDLFTATLVGVFQDFNIGFGNTKVIIGGGGSWFSDNTAQPNNPSRDQIGDVQSMSTTLDPSVTYFDHSIFTPQSDCNWFSIDARQPGIDRNLQVARPLPAALGGFTWGYDPNNNRIESHINRANSAVITISFKKPITVYSQTNAVCPHLSETKVRGCYTCPGGATVEFKVYSSCYAGSCILSSSTGTVINNTISISTEDTIRYVSVAYGMASVNDQITITCGSYNDVIGVTGTLTPYTDGLNGNNGTNGGGGGGKGDLELPSLFDIKSPGFITVVSILSALIVGAVILVIIILLWRFLPTCNLQIPMPSLFKAKSEETQPLVTPIVINNNETSVRKRANSTDKKV